MTPGASRRSASFAEVTVLEVISTAKSFARSRSTSGRSESISPTLAPCLQISRPGGRATAVSPRRSPIRTGSSLPRLTRLAIRIDMSAGAAGSVSHARDAEPRVERDRRHARGERDVVALIERGADFAVRGAAELAVVAPARFDGASGRRDARPLRRAGVALAVVMTREQHF